MARSFGKKNVVNKDIFSYNLMLLGEAGVGKTSTMAEVMRKFCKDDEYLMLQIGKEDGCKAISDLMWDSVKDWKEFTEFVKEVVTNRADWGTLRCVVIDTIDQLIDICTPHVIKAWNSSQMGTKDFKPAKTLNQAWGGFGKADEYMMSIILDEIWKLKSVNVSVIVLGHTRRRDVVDPVSGLTYSTMSAAIPLKDFDALKTKMDVVGIAYIDREMISKEYGRENIVTHKKATINEVSNEARKIAFRSSAYVLDSKSRFPEIIDEVPLNADAFVNAIQDAIDKAAANGVDVETPTEPKKPTTKKSTKKPTVVETYPDEEEDELTAKLKATLAQAEEKNEVEDDTVPFDVEEEIDDIFEEETTEDEMITLDDARSNMIRNAYKAADAATKSEVKVYLANYNGRLVSQMMKSHVEAIEKILDIVGGI